MTGELHLFPPFRLDSKNEQVWRGSEEIRLRRKTFAVLRYLVERPAELVTKAALLDAVWPDVSVGDSMPAISVRELRKALGDDAQTPRFIETVQGRGYRFIAAVKLEPIGDPIPLAAAQHSDPLRLPHNPFVGRDRERSELRTALANATSGRGGLCLISGEPGIGKTRLCAELAAEAQAKGMALLVGRCSEQEDVPYLPFVEILESYVDRAPSADDLRRAMGEDGPELGRLLPKLRRILPDLAPPLELAAEQGRRQLFNSVCNFIARQSCEQPTLLVLEDLHWADDSTLALFAHLSQRHSELPLMVICTYRESQVGGHPNLSRTLEDLVRGRLATQIRLGGLPPDEVALLLKGLSGQAPPPAVVTEIYAETEGNPFFVEELFRYLAEENRLFDPAGQFRHELKIQALEVPDNVRLVVGRRLARLSETTSKTLATAAAIGRSFAFELLEASTQVKGDPLLDCLDEAERVGLIRSSTDYPEAQFDFFHELTRQVVLSQLSVARRQRLHRQIAEAMERLRGARAKERAAEVAYHYSRSSALPGAERGVKYALAAADHAEAAYAHDEVASFLRVALELMPNDDPRRPRILGRLGLVLTLTLDAAGALKCATEAGELLAATEGAQAAADYLAAAAWAMEAPGFKEETYLLATQGLRYAGDRQDFAWVLLTAKDVWREETDDPDNPGCPVDSPRRLELRALARKLLAENPNTCSPWLPSLKLRENMEFAWDLSFLRLGKYGTVLGTILDAAAETERQGRMADSAWRWTMAAALSVALGDLNGARTELDHVRSVAARLPRLGGRAAWSGLAIDDIRLARGEVSERHLEGTLRVIEEIESGNRKMERSALANYRAAAAHYSAFLGKEDNAIALVTSVVPAIEQGLVVGAYPARLRNTVLALWLLGRADYAQRIERSILGKLAADDVRAPMCDWRFSLAQLCALQGRHDEAIEWFAKLRKVLDQEGYRTLRAMVDFDEALMYARRGAPGDRERAKPLLDAAIAQFRDIGMTGWLRCAGELATTMGG